MNKSDGWPTELIPFRDEHDNRVWRLLAKVGPCSPADLNRQMGPDWPSGAAYRSLQRLCAAGRAFRINRVLYTAFSPLVRRRTPEETKRRIVTVRAATAGLKIFDPGE